MKFPPMTKATLSWAQPELNIEAEKSIDFYGTCDYDPTGPAEARAQRTRSLRGIFGDGSSN
jgi:hypothetical protein